LLNLYDDAKWSYYTSDISKLLRAVKNSNIVVSAEGYDILVGVTGRINDQATKRMDTGLSVHQAHYVSGLRTTSITTVVDKSVVRQTLLQTDLLGKVSNSL